MEKRLTIYDIKYRVKNAPYFFSRATMKGFGQRLKDFSVYKLKNGNYRIVSPSYWDGKLMGTTERIFNPNTNEFI